MKRFWKGRRNPRLESVGTAVKADGAKAGAGRGLAELEIEELEPRLTPNYPGTDTGTDPNRTVGWGC